MGRRGCIFRPHPFYLMGEMTLKGEFQISTNFPAGQGRGGRGCKKRKMHKCPIRYDIVRYI